MTERQKRLSSEWMRRLHQATSAEQIQEIFRESGTDCSLEDAQELADLNLQVLALG